MSNVTTNKLAGQSNLGNEYLIFKLAQEEYGMDILKVQEIRHYEHVTRIPNAPDFITGVTNLRGVIVPIIDLRVKFHLGSATINDDTVVIVLNLDERVVGIVVDGVSDVLSLDPEQIKPAPDFSATLSTKYLLGLGLLNERMLILIDIEKLISSEEMEIVDKIAQGMNE